MAHVAVPGLEQRRELLPGVPAPVVEEDVV